MLLGNGGVMAGMVFPNRFEKDFEGEQELAAEVAGERGVPIASPGDPGFGDIIGSNDAIKWAILEDGSLVVMPKFVNGQEVPHSLLSGGRGVLAAGEAQIAQVPGSESYGITINRVTGHFLASAESLELGVAAFEEAGITFAEVDPEIPDA
jgi:hypothetical protein